jgi:polyhydroxyalkanoate synthesis regulator phasin
MRTKPYKPECVAINPKWQGTINKFIRADEKYSRIVDETGDDGGLRQERAYDTAYELLQSLPKRERNRLNSSYLISVWGY